MGDQVWFFSWSGITIICIVGILKVVFGAVYKYVKGQWDRNIFLVNIIEFFLIDGYSA